MLVPDLRYAVRSLRRVPVFTLAAVASLAIGIATSTTVFSLVDAAMLRPPPFADPSRLTVLNITQRTPVRGRVAPSLVVATVSTAATGSAVVRGSRDRARTPC